MISTALPSASKIPFHPHFSVTASQKSPVNAIVCVLGSWNSGHLSLCGRKGAQNGSIQWSRLVLRGSTIPKQAVSCQLPLLFLLNIVPNFHDVSEPFNLIHLFPSQWTAFLSSSLWKYHGLLQPLPCLPPSLKTYLLPHKSSAPSQKQLSKYGLNSICSSFVGLQISHLPLWFTPFLLVSFFYKNLKSLLSLK